LACLVETRRKIDQGMQKSGEYQESQLPPLDGPSYQEKRSYLDHKHDHAFKSTDRCGSRSLLRGGRLQLSQFFEAGEPCQRFPSSLTDEHSCPA
jgi:hypothetical protein